MSRILVISISDLARDPRVVRQIDLLRNRHQVIAAGQTPAYFPRQSSVPRFLQSRRANKGGKCAVMDSRLTRSPVPPRIASPQLAKCLYTAFAEGREPGGAALLLQSSDVG
jgi:hypothetical protein